MTPTVAGDVDLRWEAIKGLVSPVLEHLREPAFWVIQAAVIAITALHVAVETIGVTLDERALVLGLHHIPVVLYLLPIAYAGLRYGFEGALLTGAWCLVLTVPNMVIWHPHGWEWLGEAIYVGLVITIGVVIAVPVERERRRRRELAATSRRLALLNDLGSELVATAELERSVERVLERLVETLDLEAAVVATRTDNATVEPIAAVGPATPRVRLTDRVVEAGTRSGSDGPVLTYPLLDREAGVLAVAIAGEQPLSPDDVEILGAVADRIGTAIDNAALHRREREQLRRYVRGVTRAQEEERRRVALELHDTVTQDVVRLNRRLDGLASRTDDGAVADDLRAIRSITGVMLDGLRRLSRDLRPSVLDDLGLPAALEWLATDVRSRGIDVAMRLDGTARRLAAEAELALFRITQEALRNVERHAHADRVTVRLAFGQDAVNVTIEDDGRGFHVARDADGGRDVSGRLGIVGMHERAELVGGTLTLDSEPGRGTRIDAVVPTDQRDQARRRGAADTR